MGSTNKFFGDFNNGLGLDLWFEKEPFTSTNGQPRYSFRSSRVQKYSNNPSLPIVTSIFRQRNSGNDEGLTSKFAISSQTYNNDEFSNDTSLISIIEYLQKWKATYVDYADFVYLKNLGVYPTNRLMIARRFPSPVINNLYQIDETPISTMISWMPEDSDFFSITYGEEWESEQEASLTSVLNSIGGDLPFIGKKIGDKAEGGGKVFSLPGWTEGIQIEILRELGYLDYEANNPPLGNPNLIRESSRRSLVGKNYVGSGLSGKFSIKFTVEYEQKYINGIDPSFVYMDIIQKSLMFGTSRSVFQFNTVENKFNEFIQGLVSGNLQVIFQQLGKFVESLLKSVQRIYDEVSNNIQNFEVNKSTLLSGGNSATKTILGNVIGKYRIKLLSVVQALTGAPSGYWHVTLGNPKKPFFCCGDMITTAVTLTFGNILSYNDLPSSIKIEFTLGSARNLGGQEIMDALNTGQGRTYVQKQRSYVEVPLGSGGDEEDRKIREKKFEENVKSSVNLNRDGIDLGPKKVENQGETSIQNERGLRIGTISATAGNGP